MNIALSLLFAFLSINSNTIINGKSLDDLSFQEKEKAINYFFPIVKMEIPKKIPINDYIKTQNFSKENKKRLRSLKKYFEINQNCTGTFALLDSVKQKYSNYIITAAHCLDYVDMDKNIIINGEKSNIIRIIKGNSKKTYKDYAFLEVTISSNNYKVPRSKVFSKGEKIVVAGYGGTDLYSLLDSTSVFRFGFNSVFYDFNHGKIEGSKYINQYLYSPNNPILIFLDFIYNESEKGFNSNIFHGDSGSPLMLAKNNDYIINYEDNSTYGIASAAIPSYNVESWTKVKVNEKLFKDIENEDINTISIFLLFNDELINKFREFIIYKK